MKIATLALSLLYASTANAFFYWPQATSSVFDNVYDDLRSLQNIAATFHDQATAMAASTPWRVISTKDTSPSYTMRMRIPELEDSSIAASLAPDGKTLKIEGKRKIDGCTCGATTVREVSLPYRPRAEDIGLSLEPDQSVLTVTLAREAEGDAAVPIAVAVKEPAAESPKDEVVPVEQEKDKEPTLADKERTLTEKFRAAGAAASAASKLSADESPEP